MVRQTRKVYRAKLRPRIRFWERTGSYFLVAFLVLGAYLLGVTKGYTERISVQDFNRVFKKEFMRAGYNDVDFSLYWKVIDALQDRYPRPINFRDLLYGSIQGGVTALGDPYTVFNTPLENKEFFSDLEGRYEGVGMELELVGNQIVVVAPLPGSPAEKAGLLAQDILVAIDGQSVENMSISSVINKVRGPEGTTVRLVVQRGDSLVEIPIKRGKIVLKSADLVFDDNIAVIKIAKFNSDAGKLFKTYASEIVDVSPAGIILDLRNDPGGFLDTAVEVANEFLQGGLILEERFKGGSSTPFSADGSGRLTQYPLVVLVNSGSASAAEIVAGALRDNGRAVLVGEKTFGKGSVQEVKEFPDSSSLKVTIAEWFTPSGLSISKGGLIPNVKVVDDPETEVDEALMTAKKVLAKTD